MLTYLCACVCVYIYISFFSLLFIDFHSKSVWTDSIYLCNDTGNDDTGGSDIFMTLCIINLNSLHINPSCTRKRSLSCRHQWLIVPSIILPPPSPEMFSNNEFSILQFDCCLRERIVPILQSFIKKNQMSIRFYFHNRDRILK